MWDDYLGKIVLVEIIASALFLNTGMKTRRMSTEDSAAILVQSYGEDTSCNS